MPTGRRTASLSAIFLLFGSVAAAQTVSSSGAASATANVPACSMMLGPIRGTLVAGRVAPYSATVEHSHTQTLADGTVISPKPQTEKTFRDSQGRTRVERTFCQAHDGESIGTYVEIRDPVAGFAYILDPEARAAYRYTLHVRERDSNSSSTKATGAAGVPIPQRPPAAAATNQPDPPNTPESLGSETIEGVLCEGTRSITTIAVGDVGNDRPFNVIHETWISPELHVVVLSKVTDPRFGESTMRLTNIDLTEPALSVFQPPSDYTVAEETEHVTLSVPARQ
jgi:hypothetical protein